MHTVLAGRMIPSTDNVAVSTPLKKDVGHPPSMLSERHHSAETQKASHVRPLRQNLPLTQYS